MESYSNLVEGIEALKEQGYTEDFNQLEDCLETKNGLIKVFHNEFEIDKWFRIEGADSSPESSSILYAISSEKYGLKGIMVNAYGVYSDASTDEMLAIALRHKPHAACIVPEKREERTTEGGLDVARLHNQVAPFVNRLRDAKIRVSLFIEPSKVQVAVAEALGAPVVELHTGRFVELVNAGDTEGAKRELENIREAAADGHERGLEIHAGHGLTYETVRPVARIAAVRELNIGHFIMGEALFDGLETAVKRMRREIDDARGEA